MHYPAMAHEPSVLFDSLLKYPDLLVGKGVFLLISYSKVGKYSFELNPLQGQDLS